MAVTVLPRNKLTKTAVNRGLTAARRGLPADHLGSTSDRPRLCGRSEA